MGMFRKWLIESAIYAPSQRSETTTMAEKVEIVGGVANFRQLVDDYREKSGDSYDINEDPLFMGVDQFRSTYGS